MSSIYFVTVHVINTTGITHLKDTSNPRNHRLIAAVRYKAAKRPPLRRILCLKDFANLWREYSLKMWPRGVPVGFEGTRTISRRVLCVCVCVCVDVTATDAVDERQDIILTPSYVGVISVVYIPAVCTSDLKICYGDQRSDCMQPAKQLYCTRHGQNYDCIWSIYKINSGLCRHTCLLPTSINPSKTKVNLNYIKIQSVSRSKHTPSRLKKTSQFILYRELFAFF
jgi:hypothetical protein